MKMKQNFLKLSLLCSIVFAHLLQTQSQSFIVGVVQFLPPNVNRFSFRCYGTVFTPNHVLTTASCASVVSPFAMACQHQEAIRSPDGTSIRTCKSTFNCFYYQYLNSFNSVTDAVDRVFIHPNYSPGEIMENNVAVLHVSKQFNQLWCS